MRLKLPGRYQVQSYAWHGYESEIPNIESGFLTSLINL